MTAPQQSPWKAISGADEQHALDEISSMMTGSQELQDQPGVVFALQQVHANPAQAGAIDQFMQGMDAEKQVTLAQRAGTKITLSPQQKLQLDNLGIDYSTVEFTQQDAMNDAANQIKSGSNGQYEAKRDANGNVVVDPKTGQIQTVDTSSHYKAKGFGRLFHDINNDVLKPVERDALHPIGVVATKGYNWANTNLSEAIDHPGDIFSGSHISEDMATDMRLQGYDPGSFWSQQAYAASGKAHTDLTKFQKQWDDNYPNGGVGGWNGQQAVQQAVKFADDPKGFTSDILNNKALSPDQIQQQMAAINSPAFSTLVRQVSGHGASVGNDITRSVGIDPVKHPEAFALTSAGVNLGASFLIDPTIALGSAVKISKLAQVGIDSLGDSERAAKILDPGAQAARAAALPEGAGQNAALAVANNTRTVGAFSEGGSRAANVQRGWQFAIDKSHEMAAAAEAGDTAKAAGLMAQIKATVPGIAPLVPDIVGKNKILGYEEVAGKAQPILGQGDGIHNLADAADYVASKAGLTRLMNGRAATQASYMPGALSAFGLRKLKGLVAGWMTERSAQRADKAYSTVINAAEADPSLARKLIEDGQLIRLQPQADDAINALSDQVIAQQQRADALMQNANAAAGTSEAFTLSNAAQAAKVELAQTQGQLASAQRATETAAEGLELTPKGKGAVAYNLRRSGNPVGGSAYGWATPTAIAARTRLAAQRWSTLLPRNTIIDINDASSADKLTKMAMTYLNRGDAHALGSAWALGDEGQRKAIIGGLLDQVSHAAGLPQTRSGKELLDTIKTRVEQYSSVGDEVTKDGQNLALHEGQVRTEWHLPSFRDFQKASSKIGLWEATLGRPLTSDFADRLMSLWKFGALFRYATVTRNQLEGWLRTALEGQFGDAVKAKAIASAPNKELWERGLNLEARDNYNELLAGGKTREAKQLANSSMLTGQGTGRNVTMTHLTQFAPLALAGRAYRHMFFTHMSPDEVDAIIKLGPQTLQDVMEGYSQQYVNTALGERAVADDAGITAKAGYGPARLKYATQEGLERSRKRGEKVVGWSQQSADGTVGADRFENALAMRVNATPDVARAVMDHIEDPANFDIQHVVKALDANKRHTAFGNVYWEEPDGKGPALDALTDGQRDNGKEQWASKVVADYDYLLRGRNGQYQQELADHIRDHGTAPNADWISSHLKGDARPNGVLAPEVVAMPNGGLRGLTDAILDVTGEGYKFMVERPLRRTTTSPVFLANYAKTRVGLNPVVDRLVDSGIGREAAEKLTEDLAMKNALVKTEQLVDDPGQKSQLDIVGRNFFGFSRAVQAMWRRWGSGLWQDPTRARKMMLAFEGAQQSGLMYKDQYGQWTFAYPGSSVTHWVMQEVSHIPGFGGIVKFPVSATMTGGVSMAVPGANDPFRMSMSPMAAIPMRAVFDLFPDHREMLDQVDSAINGSISQSQGIGGTLEPSAFKKFFAAMNDNERNSALAGSTVGAIQNLAASGLIPDAGASQAERNEFIKNLQTQVRSQLFLRAVLGFFAPAQPSAPEEHTGKTANADFAFQEQGVKGMKNEYLTILNDVKGDTARANAIWTAMHPDEMAFTMPMSQATTSKVYLPSTQDALNWMQNNRGFITKYGNVAAYFLPVASGNQPFNDQAYRTQIELGLREKKSPGEFLNEFYTRNAEAVYYPRVQQFDEQIATAKANGDVNGERQATQEKSDWETQFKNLNPLFQQKIDAYPDARATALTQLQNLRDALQHNAIPDGQGPAISSLIQAYDGYESFIQQHKGSGAVATAQRSQALNIFNDWAQQHFANSPLLDLYQGVFRVLNTNFVNLSTTNGTAG